MLRAKTLTKPSKRTTPDVWARENRIYPTSHDRPGARDPGLTPYVIDFERAFDDPKYSTVVLVCGAQMGKTETLMDVIGHRFDQRPTPQMYVGPSQDFITDEFEPRLIRMIDESPPLALALTRGKKNKRFRKVIGGVPIRLAWAGSPTQLRATSAGLVIIDEYDAMLANVGNNGDPLGLVKARGFSFRDRKYGVVSTPLVGNVETVRDKNSGLEFWKRMSPDDLESPIWKLFQSGTMFHFAWPCPHCTEYFIPRQRQIVANAKTPSGAKRHAYVECPRCKGKIEEHHKQDCNARGVYVAPGQRVLPDGTLVGEPPESTIAAYWVSGICSPFVTIGERAADLLEAQESGDPARVQTSINTSFGEVYAKGGGDAPETTEVTRLRQPYKIGDLPAGSVVLTAALDVQPDGIYYGIRAWGAKSSSWLIDRGFLNGDTTLDDVWDTTADLITAPIHGHSIKKVIVDSGFRPGKTSVVPLNRVYEFCRRFPRLVSPSKGRATQSVPIRKSKIEVTPKGQVKKYSLELLLLDTDFFKSWVHERIRWPEDKPGSWLLPENVGDEYCAQIVSESRVKKPSGQVTWVRRRKDNHFLDIEAMNAAAAYLLNTVKLREGRGVRETLSSDDDIGAEIEAEMAAGAGSDGGEPRETARVATVKELPKPAPPRRRTFADISAALNR